jgi:hypothetical protein
MLLPRPASNHNPLIFASLIAGIIRVNYQAGPYISIFKNRVLWGNGTAWEVVAAIF